jgi:hypothetical protein
MAWIQKLARPIRLCWNLASRKRPKVEKVERKNYHKTFGGCENSRGMVTSLAVLWRLLNRKHRFKQQAPQEEIPHGIP